MWEAACEYFQWCVDNPLEVPLSGRGSTFGKATTEKKARPFTMQGLCRYLDANVAYFRQFKLNLGDEEKDFSTVIHAIEEVIYQQKFEMAAVGVFQHNIIARDLGLSDKTESKTDITTNGESLNNMPEWFDQTSEQSDKGES